MSYDYDMLWCASCGETFASWPWQKGKSLWELLGIHRKYGCRIPQFLER